MCGFPVAGQGLAAIKSNAATQRAIAGCLPQSSASSFLCEERCAAGLSRFEREGEGLAFSLTRCAGQADVLTVEYRAKDGKILLQEGEFCEDLQTVVTRAQEVARRNPLVECIMVRNERGDVQWAWIFPAALDASWHPRDRNPGRA
jgi:Lon protease-like protein